MALRPGLHLTAAVLSEILTPFPILPRDLRRHLLKPIVSYIYILSYFALLEKHLMLRSHVYNKCSLTVLSPTYFSIHCLRLPNLHPFDQCDDDLRRQLFHLTVTRFSPLKKNSALPSA